jgi:glycosyltransferase involved in cell wall biosynthesis
MTPIRVMHFIPGEQWAGAEAQAVTLIERLRDLHVEVRAVVFHHGKVASTLEGLGIDVTVIDQRAMTVLACLTHLTQQIRTFRPTAVHVHRYRETVLAAAALWRWSDPPLVRTVHGLPEPFHGWKGIKMAVYHGLERMAIRASGATLIAVSENTGAYLRRVFPRAAIHVVPNGITDRRVRPAREREAIRREWGIAADAPVIGFVGRLAPIKGADLFLQTAVRLSREFPSLRAVLVGDGEQRGELEAYAAGAGFSGVRFLGQRDDVGDVLAAIDVVMIPSRHEGLPLVLLETMTAGRPIVATAVGGIPEVVDARSAWLVAPESVDALTEATRAALTDPMRAEALAKRAQSTVHRFSAERMAERVIDVYRSMEEGGQRPPSLETPGRDAVLLSRSHNRTAARHAREEERSI